MKKLFILILFSLSTLAVWCQNNVFISVKLKMKPGTTIRFSRNIDNITFNKERLATVKTGIDSSFSVAFSLKNPDIINISVNELNLEALIYPDIHYIIEIASSQDEHSGNLMITACNQRVNPQLILNKAYNVFSDSTLSLLLKQNNQRATKKDVDFFNAAINKALLQTNDPFCKNLIQSLRLNYLTMSRAVNFSSALNQYFNCDSLPLSNPAFQSLLSSNFRIYFSSGPQAITKLNLFQGIPDSLHFINLLQIMSVDPSLKCIAIREEVLLENLYSLITNNVLSVEKGIKLFREASISAVQPFNRQIAENLILNLTRQQAGSKIPDFNLIFPDETIHPLSTFKGKPLHITFFTLKGAADRTILSQVAEVMHYADSLGIARFVCVTSDVNREKVRKYWSEKKYPMQLCFSPDDYELIDYFNAYSLPSFILLDSQGRIKTLAPNFPGEQLIKLLKSVYQSDFPNKPKAQNQSNQQDSQHLPDSPHPPLKK